MNAPGCAPFSLDDLPSAVLAQRLDEMMTRERHCLVDFLLHLAAFDRQRGYLELGYDSLYVYCNECLKMSNGTAYRRTTCAQLIGRFPAILDYLRDGRLSTGSVCELRNVLNEDNYREILERASGLNERQIKVLVATLDPKPEVADSIRRVAVRSVPVPVLDTTSNLEVATPTSSSLQEPISAAAASSSLELAAAPATVAWVTLPPKPTELEPINAERYSVKMTVSKEFVDELRQVTSALSHVVPSGKPEDVLRECIRIAREVCARRTCGAARARATPAPSTSNLEVGSEMAAVESSEPGSRYIPVDVRRQVFERDEGCCTFIGANGKRCRSTYRLQFHHKVPFARGGLPTCENLTLHCARHNRLQAYKDFGTAYMDRFVALPSRTQPCRDRLGSTFAEPFEVVRQIDARQWRSSG